MTNFSRNVLAVSKDTMPLPEVFGIGPLWRDDSLQFWCNGADLIPITDAVAPTLALLGDSLMSQHWATNDRDLDRFTQLAFWQSGNELAGAPVASMLKHGVSGDLSTAVATRVVDVPVGTGCCAVLMGTNDILTVNLVGEVDTTIATIQTNLIATVDNLKSRHIIPILVTLPPNDNATALGVTTILLINAWITKYAADNNLHLLPMFDALVDSDSTAAAYRTGATEDGTHLTNVGADLVAPLVAEIIADIYGSYSRPVSISQIDSTENDSRNEIISDNPGFTTVAGTGVITNAGSGSLATGTVADGWRFYDNAIASLTTALTVLPQVRAPLYLSKQGAVPGVWETTTFYSLDECVESGGTAYQCLIPHTSGVFATDLAADKWKVAATIGNCQQMDMTLALASNNYVRFYQANAFTSQFIAGKYVHSEALVELIRPNNVSMCQLVTLIKGTNVIYGIYDYKYSAAGGSVQGVNSSAMVPFKRYLKSPKTSVDAASGAFVNGNLELNLQWLAGATGSCIVRISNAGCHQTEL